MEMLPQSRFHPQGAEFSAALRPAPNRLADEPAIAELKKENPAEEATDTGE